MSVTANEEVGSLPPSIPQPSLTGPSASEPTVPDPSLLPVAVGIVELALGCLSLAFPTSLDIPAYPDTVRQLARMAMVFVAAGVIVLLSYAARSRWSGSLPFVLAVLGAFPLLAGGIFGLARGRVWSVPIVGAILGIGVLADAWRPSERPAGAPRPVPTLAMVAAVLAALDGYMIFGPPAMLRLPVSLATARLLPHLGWSLYAAASVLAVGWVLRQVRALTQVIAAVPLIVFAAVFVLVGRWPAVLTYGVVGVLLLFESLLHPLLQQRMSQRREGPRHVTDYELATEVASWGFVLLVAAAGSVESADARRLALAVLALATSLFTFIWFHVLSVRGAGLPRTVQGIAVGSLLVGILVEVTGGLTSHYFFVYFVPILALAWTQAPRTIVVPLTIPLVFLLTDLGLALRSGGGDGGMLLSIAVPLAGGLLLVSGFSYMLARRNVVAQQRARETNRQLQAVLSQMGEGLITTDEYGQVTLYNPVAGALLRHDPNPQGQLLTDVLPLRRGDGNPLPAGEHPVRRALAGQKVAWERFTILTAQGRAVPLAVAATPVTGAPVGSGAVVLLRDIHSEVETERVRDDFFFIASHELRTPLTVMKGNLEMALEVVPAGPLKITLDEALRSASRLIRMVNDFLDAARLEHGSLTVRLEDAPLPDLVQQAVETLRPDAERKGLTVTYRPTPGLQTVRMDSERTLQILLNLLGNSVRYTNSGQIEVWHEVRDGTVETLIRDSGIGIAPDHQDRLFTRFGQVERGLTRVTSGSGLGLYISKKLAEQMGGTVVLKQSAPGQGSTFALILPTAGAAGPGR